MILGRKLGTLIGSAVIAALICGPLASTANAATNPSSTHGGGFVIKKSDQMEPRIAYGSSIYGNPDSVDLRAWAVPAGDQGSLNSCVSWTLGYTIAGWYANKMGTSTTFAPMYIYSQTHLSNSYDGGGSYVRDAMNVISTQGVDTYADYQPQGNFNFTDAPTDAQRANAAAYKTLSSNNISVNRLYSSASGNIGGGAQNAIEQSLAAGRPVGLAIPIYQSFYYVDNTSYNYTNADATGGIYGYHYLSVLGYDSTGVWAENSWGTWWGQNGFVHLDWAFVNTKSVEAETVYGFAASSLPSQQTTTPTPDPTDTPTTPVATPTVDTPTVDTPTADPTTEPTDTPTTPVVTPTVDTPTTPVVEPTTPAVTVTPPTVTQTVTPVTQPTQTVTAPTTPVTQVTTPDNDVNVPTAPGKANVTNGGTKSLNLRWNTPSSNGGADITGYKVTIATGSWSRMLVTTSPTAVFADLTPNTTYTVNVRAVNSAGYSNPSVSTVTTDAAAPTIASVKVKAAKSAVTTSWSAKSVGKDSVSKIVIVIKQGSKTITKKTYKANVRKATVKLSGNKKKAYKMAITVYAKGGKHVTSTKTVRL